MTLRHLLLLVGLGAAALIAPLKSTAPVRSAQAQITGQVTCSSMQTTAVSTTSVLVASAGITDGVQVCGVVASAAAASVVTLSSCATGNPLTVIQLAAGTTKQVGNGVYRGFSVPSNDALCASATTAANITVSYNRVGGPPLPTAGFDCDFTSGSACSTTTVRSTEGTIDDVGGNWSVVGANLPRISSKGLLVEGARTNGVTNNTMAGAVVGSPGTRPTGWPAFTLAGLTQSIVAIGSQNGVDTIDFRFSGTTNATTISLVLENSGVIVVTNGQVVTSTAFFSLVGGDLTNVSALSFGQNIRDSGGANLGNVAGALSFTPNSSLIRYVTSGTIANASAAFILPRLDITVANASAVDFTIRVGWPQTEVGAAYATSPIRTAGAAATRSADFVTANNFSSWYNPNAGTLFVIGQTDLPAPTASNRAFLDANVNLSSNESVLFLNATPRQGFVVASGGAGQASFTFASYSTGVPFKMAGSFMLNAASMAADGVGSVPDNTVAVPVGVTQLAIGSRSANVIPAEGYIRRATYWPFAMNQAQMMQLTSP